MKRTPLWPHLPALSQNFDFVGCQKALIILVDSLLSRTNSIYKPHMSLRYKGWFPDDIHTKKISIIEKYKSLYLSDEIYLSTRSPLSEVDTIFGNWWYRRIRSLKYSSLFLLSPSLSSSLLVRIYWINMPHESECFKLTSNLSFCEIPSFWLNVKKRRTWGTSMIKWSF